MAMRRVWPFASSVCSRIAASWAPLPSPKRGWWCEKRSAASPIPPASASASASTRGAGVAARCTSMAKSMTLPRSQPDSGSRSRPRSSSRTCV